MTVCTGNICRSPMAQVIFAAALARAGLPVDVKVDSTGVSDEEWGNPIDRRAVRALIEHGYTVPQHQARQVTVADLQNRDLTIAMTYRHYQVLQRLAQSISPAPVIMMARQFAPEHQGSAASSALDVADPWYGGQADFAVTLAELEAIAPGVVAWVAQHSGR
jgi:protein-tyrosine phosphatase